MCDLSDPAIKEAYELNIQIKFKLKIKLNIFFKRIENVHITYEGNSNKLIVKATGEGGIPEFLDQLEDDIVAYVYLRVIAVDDQSRRPKFVLITWIGDKVKIMRKAKVSVHKSDVKRVIQQFAIEMQVFDREDLDIDKIMKEIIKVGGDFIGDRD
ncbi:coactosin [Anaeramoeba ignava]|uniref:Coactosin n=1 Tax=Anaeramoeba ignava TaxID=1746090 RepID=A0A9Q0LQN0_ANAIG|nr:coactosin [Anaeramoeba ignava]